MVLAHLLILKDLEMAQVSRETVFFKDKTIERSRLISFVDLLLTLWCCVDDLQGEVSEEVKYLKRMRKKDTFRESDLGMDLMLSLASSGSADMMNEEASDQEKLLRSVLADVRYTTNIGAMQQVNLFLSSAIGDDDDWREDDTKVWQFSGGHYEDLFRLLVWMVSELEEIIKSFFDAKPTETNILLFLNKLRQSAYGKANGLSSLTFDPVAFNQVLGTGKYLLSPIYADFWKAIDHNYDSPKVNPIDETLKPATQLKRVFEELKNGISRFLKKPRLGVADVLYYDQLLASLERVDRAWDTVLNSSFFLGPTKQLLMATNKVFAEVVPTLGEKTEDEASYVSEYRSNVITYIEKFKHASETLLKEMIALTDKVDD